MKKKPKRQADPWRVIQVPVWNCDVLIYFGSFDGFIKRLEELGVGYEAVESVRNDRPEKTAMASTFRIKYGGGSQAVYAPKKPSLHTLVHELYHVAYGILDAKGILKDDEEAFAYLLEHLFKEATK